MTVGTLGSNWQMHFLNSDNTEVKKLANRYLNLEDYPSHIE